MTGGDVAVVGAGLIGLSIAFELAERGASVRVYDRDEPAKAASWAGAGMLAPYTEDARDDAMAALCTASLELYPRFVHRVASAGGVDPHLRLNGILHAAFGDDALAGAALRARDLRERGAVCEILDRDAALGAAPWLSPQLSGALLVRGEGYVDNRRLGRALAAACRARGALVTRIAALSVECDARRVLGVRTELGFTPAAAVVNACGAWAGSLPGLTAENLPAIVPVKGQMLSLQTPAGFVRHATWMPNAYVVPRDDGRLLIGATAEPGADDRRVTAAAVSSLLRAALDAAPSLGGFSLSEMWAGVRPGTPDGRPYIGKAPLDGLYVASGHFRNGILLAPITAQLIARSASGEQPSELAAFSPNRAKEAV